MVDHTGVIDADLITRAREGDRRAFGMLVERHYGFIFRIAWRWCGNRTDAEDIAQDVCAKLGAAIRGYRGGSAFTSWLYAMTINASRDARRRTARETVKTTAFGVQALIDGEAGAEPDERPDRLWEAVRRLPDKQRDAVLLVYGEGMSHAAAADVMAISETTVSWHVHEAKKRLKALMADAGEA